MYNVFPGHTSINLGHLGVLNVGPGVNISSRQRQDMYQIIFKLKIYRNTVTSPLFSILF